MRRTAAPLGSGGLPHPRRTGGDQFRHEALLYSGDDGFIAGTVPFLREGAVAGEAALVVVSADKIAKLRGALGADADSVMFADMAQVGLNPARIIPAWRDFVADQVAYGRGFRGIGEPIWAGRPAPELVECQRHESLLNLAFVDAPGWRLLCPYDTDALGRDVIQEACASHPYVVDGGARRPSTSYRGLGSVTAPFDVPLPAPPVTPDELTFEAGSLVALRAFVGRRATSAGLSAGLIADFVLAVSELAANSIRHGGGRGVLRMWEHDGAVVCEVSDDGRFDEPLAGRERPSRDQNGGRGLWLVNQLCDLVQVRSFPTGTVVRVHLKMC